MTDRLFQPIKVGHMNLAHRLAMAPLTRFRAADAPSHVPLPMVTTHYQQRSIVPGTLLITEGTHPFPSGAGFANSPGIWNAAQIERWREIAAAVHANGSFIFMQLWAMGRACSPEVLATNGVPLLGPSAIPISGKHETPREMTEEEIWEAINGFASAAKNALAAGMDGVELHGANGYLIDQFLQPASNQRTDAWGGSVEKRSRFAVEAVKAVSKAVGDPKKVGIRLSPWTRVYGLGMDDPIEQFSDVVSRLSGFGLAYLHLVEPRVNGTKTLETWTGSNAKFMEAWGNAPVFLAGGFTPEIAREVVNQDLPDRDVVVVFGRLWTSNPDLPYKIKNNISLRPSDRSTFYNAKEERGYTDFPISENFVREHGSKL